MNFTKPFVTALLVASISACSTAPTKPAVTPASYEFAKDNSFAHLTNAPYETNSQYNMVDNVLTMIGIKPIADTDEAKATGTKNVWGPNGVSAATTVSTTLSAPTGFSAGGAAAIGVLGMLLTGPDTVAPNAYQSEFAVAFVPTSDAQTPEAAIDYVKNGLIAYHQELAAKGLIYPITETGSGLNLVFATDDPLTHDARVARGSMLIVYPFQAALTKVVKGYAPSDLGGYPCYVVHMIRPRTGLFANKGTFAQSDKSDMNVMKARAQNTPKWLMYYLPPRNLSQIVNGKREMLQVPAAIFNGQLSLYQ